ncbi:hypothetical protein [Streptomyces sp. NPDC050355]|uniref:Chaplin n=1 Tax=Streptomyces sirii TaxID=3127701 RepID=A0ABZ2QSC2_9ACTN
MRVRTLAAAVTLAGVAVLGGAPLAAADGESPRDPFSAIRGHQSPPAETCLADISFLVDPGALRCAQQ